MGEQARILVVEDDDALRRMLAATLGRLGQVTAAATAVEALARLRDGDPPSVVVTDVMMPGMTGLELARAMRKDPRLSSVPVVILSAKSEPRDLIEGINAGARHYVTKPFKSADLEKKIAKLIRDRVPAHASSPSPEVAVDVEIEIDASELEPIEG